MKVGDKVKLDGKMFEIFHIIDKLAILKEVRT